MTVRHKVIQTIITNYPKIHTATLHNCDKLHPFSTMQRVRELRKQGVIYTVKNNIYDFSGTPIAILKGLLEPNTNLTLISSKLVVDDKSVPSSQAVDNTKPTASLFVQERMF